MRCAHQPHSMDAEIVVWIVLTGAALQRQFLVVLVRLCPHPAGPAEPQLDRSARGCPKISHLKIDDLTTLNIPRTGDTTFTISRRGDTTLTINRIGATALAISRIGSLTLRLIWLDVVGGASLSADALRQLNQLWCGGVWIGGDVAGPWEGLATGQLLPQLGVLQATLRQARV
jgi:hypothetical protein